MATTKSCSKTLDTCDYWPRCAACQEGSGSGPVKRDQSKSTVSVIELPLSSQPHVVSVAVNKSPSWTFLCSGMASTHHPLQQAQAKSEKKEKSQKVAAKENIALR